MMAENSRFDYRAFLPGQLEVSAEFWAIQYDGVMFATVASGGAMIVACVRLGSLGALSKG